MSTTLIVVLSIIGVIALVVGGMMLGAYVMVNYLTGDFWKDLTGSSKRKK